MYLLYMLCFYNFHKAYKVNTLSRKKPRSQRAGLRRGPSYFVSGRGMKVTKGLQARVHQEPPLDRAPVPLQSCSKERTAAQRESQGRACGLSRTGPSNLEAHPSRVPARGTFQERGSEARVLASSPLGGCGGALDTGPPGERGLLPGGTFTSLAPVPGLSGLCAPLRTGGPSPGFASPEPGQDPGQSDGANGLVT